MNRHIENPEDLLTPRPLDEWCEEIGTVLWWHFPIQESPYCGTPNDDGWIEYPEGFLTHWTPLPDCNEIQRRWDTPSAILEPTAKDLLRYCLSGLRDCHALLKHHLETNLTYVPMSNSSGQPHGYSVVQIAEWKIRQKLDWFNQTIARLESVK